MHKITKLEQTCTACPSQWEGELADGRALYGRYRWGFLRVGVSHTLDSAILPDRGDEQFETLFAEQVGDEYDGMMSTPEMLRHLKDVAILDMAYVLGCMVARTTDEFGRIRYFVEDPWGDWIGDAHDSFEQARAACAAETRKLRKS